MGALAASSVSLARLLAGVRVSRATVSVVRQNLAWAAAYNLVAVPLAVAGMVTPWVAAVGMSASSLVVVLNAMRLLPPPEATPAAREAGDPARAAVAARTAHA